MVRASEGGRDCTPRLATRAKLHRVTFPPTNQDKTVTIKGGVAGDHDDRQEEAQKHVI